MFPGSALAAPSHTHYHADKDRSGHDDPQQCAENSATGIRPCNNGGEQRVDDNECNNANDYSYKSTY